MRVLFLDTNIIIDLFKGDESTIKTLRKHNPDILVTSTINKYEFLRGILKGREKAKAFIELFKLIPFDSAAVDVAISIHQTLKERGRQVPEFDILIASICISRNIPMWTRDKHFERLTRFGLQLFRP